MNAVLNKVPKVHLRKSSVVVTVAPELTPTELVLRHLTQGYSEFQREMFKRQCLRPERMSKTTLWALYQLGLKLRRGNAAYYSIQLEEIRRLLKAAPQAVRSQVRLVEEI